MDLMNYLTFLMKQILFLMNYNPKTSNKINTKKSMLEYLKIMEWKLIDMFTTPNVVSK